MVHSPLRRIIEDLEVLSSGKKGIPISKMPGLHFWVKTGKGSHAGGPEWALQRALGARRGQPRTGQALGSASKSAPASHRPVHSQGCWGQRPGGVWPVRSGQGPPAAVDVIHGRNVSAAPNSHRERQGQSLGRNSWATFFLLLMWPEAIELGQTAQRGILQSPLSVPQVSPHPCPHLLFLPALLPLLTPEKCSLGKSRRPQRGPEDFCSLLSRTWDGCSQVPEGGGHFRRLCGIRPFHALRGGSLGRWTRREIAPVTGAAQTEHAL